MSRLYDISYDKEKWVFNVCDNGYQIVRKETFNSYFIGGDIIGIEQVTDDAFLVYRKIVRDAWEIARIKLTPTKKVFEYNCFFRKFYFLTEDTIIFDKDSSVSATVYSISKNCEITAIDCIISGSPHFPDSQFCKSRDIDLYYADESSEYPLHLLVGYELPSHFCPEFIQVMIDPSTLKPISPAYSTLRGKYVQLSESDPFALEKLFRSDNNNLKVIDAFLYELYCTDTRKTEAEFCADIKNEFKNY